jgi:hypothetical protein
LNNVAIGTEIRKSVDAGQTWATHATIVAPTNGTLWACVANDGDLFYNATTQTWSYLAQCLAATGGWRTCVFTRAGADPMGPFTAYGSNGSVPAPSMAALKAICATSARCAADTLGQDFAAIGTYQILGQNGAYYLISFHAGTVSGRTVRFFAVVSSDWQTWFVNQDAFLGSSDASNLFNARWDGGPVGVADGYTLAGSDGLFYTVASAMDHNVGCIEGQHWYIGLWRSSDLVTWQPRAAGAPEVNPIVSSEPDSNPAVTGSDPGCGSSYPAMWVANGTTYFAFTRNSGPMLGFLIYKLAAN